MMKETWEALVNVEGVEAEMEEWEVKADAELTIQRRRCPTSAIPRFHRHRSAPFSTSERPKSTATKRVEDLSRFAPRPIGPVRPLLDSFAAI